MTWRPTPESCMRAAGGSTGGANVPYAQSGAGICLCERAEKVTIYIYHIHLNFDTCIHDKKSRLTAGRDHGRLVAFLEPLKA